jgi:hypothetical protein
MVSPTLSPLVTPVTRSPILSPVVSRKGNATELSFPKLKDHPKMEIKKRYGTSLDSYPEINVLQTLSLKHHFDTIDTKNFNFNSIEEVKRTSPGLNRYNDVVNSSGFVNKKPGRIMLPPLI